MPAPKAVLDSSRAWSQELDILGSFVRDVCNRREGAFVETNRALKEFNSHARAGGFEQWTQNRLTRALGGPAYRIARQKRVIGEARPWCYVGLELRLDESRWSE